MRLLVMLFGLLAAAPAWAQFETGSITGIVKDTSGAAIVGAEVRVTSADTAAERTETTNDSGSYTVTNLKPGLYEVKVSHPSFGQYIQKINNLH